MKCPLIASTVVSRFTGSVKCRLLHLLEVRRRGGARDDGCGEEVGRGRALGRQLGEELQVVVQPVARD